MRCELWLLRWYPWWWLESSKSPLLLWSPPRGEDRSTGLSYPWGSIRPVIWSWLGAALLAEHSSPWSGWVWLPWEHWCLLPWVRVVSDAAGTWYWLPAWLLRAKSECLSLSKLASIRYPYWPWKVKRHLVKHIKICKSTNVCMEFIPLILRVMQSRDP